MYLAANVIDPDTHKIVKSLKTLVCPHLAGLICDIDHLHARQTDKQWEKSHFHKV